MSHKHNKSLQSPRIRIVNPTKKMNTHILFLLTCKDVTNVLNPECDQQPQWRKQR